MEALPNLFAKVSMEHEKVSHNELLASATSGKIEGKDEELEFELWQEVPKKKKPTTLYVVIKLLDIIKLTYFSMYIVLKDCQHKLYVFDYV